MTARETSSIRANFSRIAEWEAAGSVLIKVSMTRASSRRVVTLGLFVIGSAGMLDAAPVTAFVGAFARAFARAFCQGISRCLDAICGLLLAETLLESVRVTLFQAGALYVQQFKEPFYAGEVGIDKSFHVGLAFKQVDFKFG